MTQNQQRANAALEAIRALVPNPVAGQHARLNGSLHDLHQVRKDDNGKYYGLAYTPNEHGQPVRVETEKF